MFYGCPVVSELFVLCQEMQVDFKHGGTQVCSQIICLST